ncbi:MAG: hypothetical protein ACI89X_004765 [Planctomycetota bacterium]|jgi:hypothetical protein
MPFARIRYYLRMPVTRITTLVAALLLATSQLTAQTFVVDKANGPGAAFTSIATAIAAVPDGAVLVVRPGQYLSFGIDNKSMTVLGESGAEIYDLAAILQITNLTANQHVKLRGLSVAGLLGPAGLPTPLPGIADPIMLLPGTESVQASGPLTSPLQASYVVPQLPQLLGTRVTWQGVSFAPASGVQVSNAVSYAHFEVQNSDATAAPALPADTANNEHCITVVRVGPTDPEYHATNSSDAIAYA